MIGLFGAAYRAAPDAGFLKNGRESMGQLVGRMTGMTFLSVLVLFVATSLSAAAPTDAPDLDLLGPLLTDSNAAPPPTRTANPAPADLAEATPKPLSAPGSQAFHACRRPNPLFVEPESYDFSGNPQLLQRILERPHGYFRFINVAFSKEVCRRFKEAIHGAPSVNLHGDAHVEQYAITDLGRGLTDFDDSASGPPVLDWMRFGVSLRLASRAHGWETRADELLRVFFQGYRYGLENPDSEVPEPVVVRRIRKGFKVNRTAYFLWIDSLMQPIAPQESAEVLEALKPYEEAMREEYPHASPNFFQPVRLGALTMGIGSALLPKYLLRIEGRSFDPADDLVLELKQVRDLTGISCIKGASHADAFRILLGQARISYTPFQYLGYARIRGANYWIHSWVDNYKELGIQDYDSFEDFRDMARDAGIQLGRGHPKQIAAPFGPQLRRELGRILQRLEPSLLEETRAMENCTLSAWRQFVQSLESSRRPRE